MKINRSSGHRSTVYLQWLEHCWLVYQGCFELVLEFLGKIPWLQIWFNLGLFFCFILKKIYCVFSSESTQWGDSNENTQHTFMLKDNQKDIHIMPPDLVL